MSTNNRGNNGKESKHDRVARGGARWQASRLESVVKKRGTTNKKKPKRAAKKNTGKK